MLVCREITSQYQRPAPVLALCLNRRATAIDSVGRGFKPHPDQGFSVSLCGPLPILELTLRWDKVGISKHCNLPLNYFYQKGMWWCGYFNLYYIKNSTMIKEPPKYIARTVREKAVLENIYREHTSQAGQVRSEREPVKWGCGRRMRTADNYKTRKIRKDRSLGSFNLRTIACSIYPCGLILIQKWQSTKISWPKSSPHVWDIMQNKFGFKSVKT